MSFLSRSTFAPPRSVPRLTRFRTRSYEALGKTTCTRKSTILPNDNAIIHYFGFALQPRQGSPVWGNFRPNRQKPLILLGHFDFDPAKRPPQKIFFSPIFTPAARGLTHPRAPFRAFSHPSEPLRKKREADEIFTRRHLLFPSSIIASSASAEAVVEGAVAAGAFPSDAEAGAAEAASSNGGGGDDDGGVRSRRHPCVLRRTRLRRMRLRRTPR